MTSAITQQDINIFSSDPAGTKEQPQGADYTNGVEAGYTAPGKWWNWFWNKLTTWLTGCKADRIAVLAEPLNVLSAAQTSPDPSNEHQLSKAIDAIAKSRSEAYDNRDITEEIGGVQVTHKENLPYVVGFTLYLPDTELL